jgi:hypothetical protein
MHLHRDDKELLVNVQVHGVFAVDFGIKEQLVASVFHEPRMTCQLALATMTKQ